MSGKGFEFFILHAGKWRCMYRVGFEDFKPTALSGYPFKSQKSCFCKAFGDCPMDDHLSQWTPWDFLEAPIVHKTCPAINTWKPFHQNTWQEYLNSGREYFLEVKRILGTTKLWGITELGRGFWCLAAILVKKITGLGKTKWLVLCCVHHKNAQIFSVLSWHVLYPLSN